MGSERKTKVEEEKKKKRSSPEDEGKRKRHRSVEDEETKEDSRRDRSKSKKEKKKHKSSKHHSEKKSGEKDKGKRHKRDRQSKIEFQELSEDDYFSKNNEFASWLKEEKNLFFSDLSSESSRDLFHKFVKDWNNQKLESRYYEGIAIGPRTAHKWNIKQ